ncbi:MAG: hypothetical protein JXB32_16290 [Deltaproteobacteria bacterium]|nr:hypothetical protein [Deltaproteobacteria bacterium]
MMMPVQMTFRHVPLKDETFSLIHDLSSQLGRTWRDMTRCHVVVDRDRRRRRRRGRYRVRVLMSVPGRRLVANRENDHVGGEEALRATVVDAFEAAQRLLADDHDRRVSGRGAGRGREDGPSARRPLPIIPDQAPCAWP